MNKRQAVGLLFLGLWLLFGSATTRAEPDSNIASKSNGKPAKVKKPAPPEKGTALLTIETIREQTPNRRSILAKKIELWIGERRIAILKDGDPGVENKPRHRIFRFPPIDLPEGYYFVTLRAYAEGFISRDKKWKGDTFQIGIHSGRTTKIDKNFPFFVW